MSYSIVCLLVVSVTPGPNELFDMDSFLELLLAVLNCLSDGVDGVHIFGEQGTLTLKALVVFITSDIPAGDKVTNITGRGGHTPGRRRFVHGFLSGSRYYFPPVNPVTGAILFSASSIPLATRGR
eukprot:TRINITY_DN12371_c0_g1_i1.p1 TRINITY_DN12371_c0_g1~~TRINITY_DN12371_c0_g1_i1.p1  ORF type:complete len:125 (+),score=23.19 TRINITY_DN12371_c0_g1_i1:66-440(+)